MILCWRDATTLPVEIDDLTPAGLLGLSAAEAARRPARVGNRTGELGDVFEVKCENPEVLTIEGDCRHVRGIGRGMKAGTLHVRGAAGAYLAAGMSGGAVEVFGDAGDWAAAALAGGSVRVHGDAGRSLGAAFPGAPVGMKGGVVIVDGSVGDEAGARMRRGLIAVGGAAGEGFGRGLVAGTLVARGPVGRYPGIGMKRGTVVLLGPDLPTLLPSFTAAGAYRFPFLEVYLRDLAGRGFDITGRVFGAEFRRYNGDRADGGVGEILHAAAD